MERRSNQQIMAQTQQNPMKSDIVVSEFLASKCVGNAARNIAQAPNASFGINQVRSPNKVLPPIKASASLERGQGGRFTQTQHVGQIQP